MDETSSIPAPESLNRIISLSPAITRMIIDLESEDLLVGVTSFHPPLTREIDIVGTLVQPNIEKVVLLKPDIVFISEEDNKIQLTEMIQATNISVYKFPRNDSFKTIIKHYRKIAAFLGKQELANNKIKKYLQNLKSSPDKSKKKSIALFVSNQPLIGVSDMSYIGKMISDAGGTNCLRFLNQPYPILSLEHLIMLDPDIIISIQYHGDTYQVPFGSILKDFPELTVMKRDSIYVLPLNSVTYYTPGDYVLACNQITDIIDKVTRKEKEFAEEKN